MARTGDPQTPSVPYLRLLPAAQPPLPAVVPLLRPDEPVSPAEERLLTGIARRARVGDAAARDLLWTAFAPRLEPAVRRCGRMAWHTGWARRDGRPWDLADLRQEAWLVFAELVTEWNGEHPFVPYITRYFSWRLHNAMRRLGPPRRARPARFTSEPAVDCLELLDVEAQALLASIATALSATDAEVLRLRVGGLKPSEIAGRLGVSRRTIDRRWARIRRVARGMLNSANAARSLR